MNRVTTKTIDALTLSDEQLAKINRFTRRPLGREEVFVFSLILCDNEIDRDYERFTKASLDTLGEMFVGKTGVFDHSAKAKNQSARIFDTMIEDAGRLNSLGEPYHLLRAFAYMLRSAKNEELIFEIDGGIKKEVSVGCAVEKVVCSVCGQDVKTAPCAHVKGASYEGGICHYRLENPTDAYEWSFVAVPAQKGAGVTKKMSEAGGRTAGPVSGVGDLAKLFEMNTPTGVHLSAGQLGSLKAQYAALCEKAAAGDAYLAGLRGEVIRLCGLALPELAPAVSEQLAGKLDMAGLNELRACLRKAAGKALPPAPQLGGADNGKCDGDSPFVI